MNRFFESSFLTWEITSGKNLQFIEDTFKHLIYLEDNEINTWKHSETSDYYFQQRPVGGARPFSLTELNISSTAFVSILSSNGLNAEEKIEFVYDQNMDPYRQEIGKAKCLSNASYAIFFSLENDAVNYIWFDYEDRISLEGDRLAIGDLLYYLGVHFSFILVDWYDKIMIDLSDKNAVKKYLDDTAESNENFFKSINKN